eukprot:763930-Hanusia_phi.AAC.3
MDIVSGDVPPENESDAEGSGEILVDWEDEGSDRKVRLRPICGQSDTGLGGRIQCGTKTDNTGVVTKVPVSCSRGSDSDVTRRVHLCCCGGKTGCSSVGSGWTKNANPSTGTSTNKTSVLPSRIPHVAGYVISCTRWQRGGNARRFTAAGEDHRHSSVGRWA